MTEEKPTTPETIVPRGVRNCNPGNIRAADHFVWRGQSGKDEDGFCVFESPCWGFRAQALLWLSYEEHDGCVTLREYISRWAPPDENDTGSYVGFMADKLGVNPDLHINILNHDADILKYQSMYEQGGWYFTSTDLNRGLILSHER